MKKSLTISALVIFTALISGCDNDRSAAEIEEEINLIAHDKTLSEDELANKTEELMNELAESPETIRGTEPKSSVIPDLGKYLDGNTPPSQTEELMNELAESPETIRGTEHIRNDRRGEGEGLGITTPDLSNIRTEPKSSVIPDLGKLLDGNTPPSQKD